MKQRGNQKSTYLQRRKLLNYNQVPVAKHFQNKLQVFFKLIALDGSLVKIKYYALRIEFDGRRSPHVNAFLWIFDAPGIIGKTV